MANRLAVMTAATGVLAIGPATASASTWVTNAVGNWGNSANWLSPANVPDTQAESATINSGTATLDAHYDIGAFAFGGGALQGNFNLTALTLNWTRGTMAGAATTTVRDVAGIALGAFEQGNLNGRTLRLNKATTLSASDGYGLYLYNGATLDNAGAFDILNNANISAGSAEMVTNSGTLTKTGGTGVSGVTALINTGTVSVQSGTLDVLFKAGGTNTGVFNIAAGSTLSLGGYSGIATLSPTATITGSGTLSFSTGGVTFQGVRTINNPVLQYGGLATYNGATTFTQSLQLLNGEISGTAAVTAPSLNWTNGFMSGTGSTTIAGNATLTPVTAGYLYLNGRTLTLNGNTSLYSADGYGVYLYNNAVLNNTNVFTITGDNGIIDGGSGTFLNTGTLNKTGGTGTSTVGYLRNNGSVSVASGTMALSMKAAASSNGAFAVSNGRTMTLGSAGTHTLASSAAFTGQGTVRFTAGTFAADGTVNATPTTFALDGATLTGPWNLSNLTWTAGTVAGAASTTAVGGATTLSPGEKEYLYLNGHTLTLNGNTTLTGSEGYGLYPSNGAVLNNNATLTLADDSGIVNGGNSTTNNAGTIIKTGGKGVSPVSFLVNTGTVSAQAGTLAVTLANATTTAGAFTVSDGATIRLVRVGGPHTLAGPVSLGGRGTFAFGGGVFNVLGTTSVNGTTFDVADVNGTPAADVLVSGAVVDAAGAAAGLIKTGGGTLSLGGNNTYSQATTVAAGTVTTTPAAYANLLNNAGGIDLIGGGTRFVLDHTAVASPLAQLKALLTAGYAANFAAGQIRSTTATAARGLGYADDGNVLTVMATLYGDADLNGQVDFNDFLALQARFGTAGTTFGQGNFNYDAQTDFNDFLMLQANFGQSVSDVAVGVTAEQVAALTAFGLANAGVPEPAMLSLLAVVGGGLLRRRARAG